MESRVMPGLGSGQQPFLAQKPVDQGRLAGIGTSDNGNPQRLGLVILRSLILIVGAPGHGDVDIGDSFGQRIVLGGKTAFLAKGLDNGITQIKHAAAMLGRNRTGFAQAEPEGIIHTGFRALGFGLVGHQHNRLAALSQDIRQQFVGRGQPGLGVDQEQGAVGLIHGRFALGAHAAFQRIGSCDFEAGGIDHAEPEIDQTRIARTTVAGYARRVVDKRQLAAGKPVEQRRLADIGTSDNGKGNGHDGSLPEGIVSVRVGRAVRTCRRGRRSCPA
jgi:hypothetical protein